MIKYIFFTIILLILLFVLGFCELLYRVGFAKNPPKVKVNPEEMNSEKRALVVKRKAAEERALKKSYEEIKVISYDNLTLFGKFFECENAVRTVICAHGFRSSCESDFGYVLDFLLENNSNVVFITQRCHGKSEGTHLTYGYKEKYDCISWSEYISSRFPSLPIYLYGVSMGGASVCMASELTLPDEVIGIIDDCGFDKPVNIMKRLFKTNFHLPPFPLLNIFKVTIRLRLGFNLENISSAASLSNSKKPVLFVHGDVDDFVPCSEGILNYDSCNSKKQLEIFKGAKHALSMLVDEKRYQKMLLQFFNTCETNN